MAKGRKTGGRNFVHGNSLSPGRPPLPADLRDITELTPSILRRYLTKYLYMDKAQIQEAWGNPTLPSIDRMIIKIIEQSIAKGDQIRLEFILSRIIGKAVEKVEIQLPTPTIIKRIDGTVVELGSKMEDEDEDQSS